ncbi:hypothetical protein VTJ04DRAFT_10023 [Mycothermus thermophilus]|uniref:uncharacterized protein n=1 Tax=Humicola insolens TaxID=85995 RepID=UPI003743470D
MSYHDAIRFIQAPDRHVIIPVLFHIYCITSKKSTTKAQQQQRPACRLISASVSRIRPPNSTARVGTRQAGRESPKDRPTYLPSRQTTAAVAVYYLHHLIVTCLSATSPSIIENPETPRTPPRRRRTQCSHDQSQSSETHHPNEGEEIEILRPSSPSFSSSRSIASVSLLVFVFRRFDSSNSKHPIHASRIMLHRFSH